MKLFCLFCTWPFVSGGKQVILICGNGSRYSNLTGMTGYTQTCMETNWQDIAKKNHGMTHVCSSLGKCANACWYFTAVSPDRITRNEEAVHTCSFETHIYFDFRSNGTNMTSSREVFMQPKKREGKGGAGRGVREGRKEERGHIYPTQGTSLSEAVRIEKGQSCDWVRVEGSNCCSLSYQQKAVTL